MKTIVSALAVISILTCGTSCRVTQDSAALSPEEKARIDGWSATREREDSERLSVLEAKLKESERIEQDAHNATKEARLAYKAELKAQKARNRADRQALRAASAKNVADNN